MQTFDTHKSKPEVRQGDEHKTNSRVLIWSTLGVIALFIIVYLVFFVGAPPPDATV